MMVLPMANNLLKFFYIHPLSAYMTRMNSFPMTKIRIGETPHLHLDSKAFHKHVVSLSSKPISKSKPSGIPFP